VTSIFPGYVRTDLSKNALGDKKGESFGKLDSNIEKGESVESFCKKAIYGIFKKEKDLVITSNITHEFGVLLRNITFDLIHNLTYKNLKSQKEVIKKAV
jgi:hypothetical protein